MSLKSKREKAIEQCLLLKKLADGGEGEEKVKAASLMQKRMEEYSITDEELGMTLQTYKHFSYKSKREQYLLEMIIGYVVADAVVLQDEKLADTYFVECNEEEALLIKKLITFYTGCYEREEEYFFRAFILRNNLLPRFSGATGYQGGNNKNKKGEEEFSVEMPAPLTIEFTPKEEVKIQGLAAYISRYDFSENHLEKKKKANADFFSAD